MAQRGRPTTYTPEIGKAICDRLANGESLKAICQDEDMPGDSTVRTWAIDNREGFYALYARARDIALDRMADEVIGIADDGTNDFAKRAKENGGEVVAPDVEHIARSRLRFDARRWYLSKLAPKKYGDRIATEISGPDGGPVQIDDSTAAAKLAALMNLAQTRKENEPLA